jgi:hypothetical protein
LDGWRGATHTDDQQQAQGAPTCMHAYLDEAVVEEEAEDGGPHPRLLLHGGGHPGPHDGLQAGAARVVERRRQLRHGAERQRARHGQSRQ